MFIYRVEHKYSKLGPYTHNNSKKDLYNKLLKKHMSPRDINSDLCININISLYKFFWKSIDDVHSFINGCYSLLNKDGFIIVKYFIDNMNFKTLDNQILVKIEDLNKKEKTTLSLFSI